MRPHLLRGRPVAAGEVDPRDAGFSEALYVGVVKGLLSLRHRIEHHADRKWSSLDELTKKILLLGAYQLVSMDRVSPASAVNHAVEQCKRLGSPQAAGMVNAVLRNFLRQEPPEISPLDPEAAYSFPEPLFNRLVSQLGVDPAIDICRHANREPALTLRLFPGVTVADLAAEGVPLVPHEVPGLVVATGAKRAQLAKWADAGLAQPQDPTAALVATFCDLRPGLSVLDRCAGVGTKAVQFHSLVAPKGDTSPGVVHAIDPDPHRCQTLRDLIARRGLADLHVHQAAGSADLPGLPAAFDRVLVDVPCSNSGVLARRPEARYHQSPAELASLRGLQLSILTDAAARVNPATGLLIYSTCSIYPDENRGVVDAFLAGTARPFRLLRDHLTLPGGEGTTYHDGGYVAVLAPGA